ncbi:hypothetical protein E2P81_ATG02232 [Venturia nashicola]|nr:hypothetical protein E2P81_ATG02232 [Venturia nashicola]
MAADLAPTFGPPLILEKQTKSADERPSSIQSSEAFFDANEKLRIQTPNMSEISSTLSEPFSDQAFLQHEYQSSEEALSLMLDDMDLSDEEQEMEPDVVEDGLWNDIKCFDLDMAISICIIAVGQAKMINLGHFRSPQIRPSRPDRISPLPATIPSRSRERAPSMRVQTRFSNESLRHYTFSASPAELSPESSDASSDQSPATPSDELPVQSCTDCPDACSKGPRMDSLIDDAFDADKRHGSFFSTGHSEMSSMWAPPPSDREKEQESELVEKSPITPSFLQVDPFESNSSSSNSISGKSASSKSSHSRFRSISTKFSIFGLNKQDAKSEEPKKHLKKERRNSLFQPIAPQSMGRISNEEESRSNSRPESPQPAALVAPKQISPRDSTFSKKRMIARGANERQPAIVLPPCPYEDEDAPAQPVRSSTLGPRKRNGNDDLKRRKSLLSMVPH